jgi:hypothetical protein
MNGKTMVGSNYDAYYLSTRIWFENATVPGEFGALFSGGRYDGNNGVLPQSGMNEAGLTFSRLAAPTPGYSGLPDPSKKAVSNPTAYLKDILHKCATVEQVKEYVKQFDHSYFPEEISVYVDKSGRYLIVEPDTMIFGDDSKYVQANFCPSRTDPGTVVQQRYIKGLAFLKDKQDTTVDFCTALSDTMSVCRERMGDGTLLTSIRDLNEGMLYLYFYHDFSHQVKFKLKDELAKGDHMFQIPELFTPNDEYEALRNYVIPHNSNTLMIYMLLCAGLFLFSSFYFLFSFFRRKKTSGYLYMKLILSLLGIILFYYIYILARNETIFFFPAPYKDYKFSMLTITAYIPFLLLLLLIPLLITNIKIFKEKAWSLFSASLFAINNLGYLSFIVLFAYWGLYSIF